MTFIPFGEAVLTVLVFPTDHIGTLSLIQQAYASDMCSRQDKMSSHHALCELVERLLTSRVQVLTRDLLHQTRRLVDSHAQAHRLKKRV